MCAEYEVRTTQKHIEEVLQRSLVNTTGQEIWDQRIKFTVSAPVIEMGAEGPRLTTKVFPVRPFPNARLSNLEEPKASEGPMVRRIYDLPTWKTGFQNERCVAVMTSFFEPVYWGSDAGSVMRFRPSGAEVFFVAAIGIKPMVPSTGKRNGFALLTHRATPQMLDYHHRLVVILSAADALTYISGEASPREAFDYLIEHQDTRELSVVPERKMAKGWEKRVEPHKSALKDEKNYTTTLEREGVRG